MFSWISKWLEDKVIGWLAGKLGIDKNYLAGIIDEVIAFIKEIFGAFGKGNESEAVVYMRAFVSKAKPVSGNGVRAALKKMLAEL